MEDQRSSSSGDFDVRDDVGDDRARASSIAKTAGVSVIGLVLVVGWMLSSGSSAEYARPASNAAAAGEPPVDLSAIAASGRSEMATSDIAMIGPSVVGELVAQYQTLKNNGEYTPEAAAALAQQLGEQIVVRVPYHTYTVQDINTTNDNSYQAMLAYRESLQAALESMTDIKDFELGIFAKYSETKDPAYLQELRTIVAMYTASTKEAANLAVPSEAAMLHASVLNAMGQFAAVLEGLSNNADDPITVITLLRTYNEAEGTMLTSFNNLAMYFAHHSTS